MSSTSNGGIESITRVGAAVTRYSDLSTVPSPPGGSRPSEGVGYLWDGGIRTSRVPSMSVTPDFRRSYLEVSSTVDKIMFSMRCILAICCVCGAYQQLVVNVIGRLILLLATCRDNGLLCELCMLMRELVFCRVCYHSILLCLWCMLATCAAC